MERGGARRTELDPATQKAVVVGRGGQPLAAGGAIRSIRFDPLRSALKQLLLLWLLQLGPGALCWT
jgi:hypothetical protein